MLLSAHGSQFVQPLTISMQFQFVSATFRGTAAVSLHIHMVVRVSTWLSHRLGARTEVFFVGIVIELWSTIPSAVFASMSL